MKALVVCQPYAHLIMTTDAATGEKRKRVENRSWPTSYRGSFYLLAGKSRSWLEQDGDPAKRNYGIPLDSMVFGAIVGIARLVDCLYIDEINNGDHDQKYPWLREHEHTNGEWCWILENVVPIGPWPWRGAQGLFNIDDKALDTVANRVLEVPRP